MSGPPATQAPVADFALDVLQRMFPAPHRVGRRGDVDAALQLYAVPSLASPRYLVPARPRAAGAQVVARQLIGGRLRTRAARALTVAALRSGVRTARWPQGYAVDEQAGAPSVLGWLRDQLREQDVVVSVALGRPRANRKPVIQLADAAGRTLGFAKVGHNELTRRLVQAETLALREVGSAPLRHVEVPRVVAATTWDDLELLLMTPLDVGPQRRPLRRERLVQAVAEIAAVGGVERARWATTPHAAALTAEAADLPTDDPLAVAVRDLHRLDPLLDNGSWHGDLNPGNLVDGGERVLVWDWERFERGVPVGLDLLHHDLQRAITVRSVPPGPAALDLVRSAADTLAPLGVAIEQAPAVVLDYLVTIGLRFTRDRQDAAGSRLGRVHEWLVPAIDLARSHADHLRED